MLQSLFFELNSVVVSIRAPLKDFFIRFNPNSDHISADAAANIYAISQVLCELSELPGSLPADLAIEYTGIASALESSYSMSKTRRKLLLRRAVNLRKKVAGVYQKQRLTQMLGPEAEAQVLQGREEEVQRIVPLRDTPLLAYIGKRAMRLNEESTTDHIQQDQDPNMPVGPEGIRIGPLPEDWFSVPSNIDAKFQSLLDCMPEGYSKGKEAHAIAYDVHARCVYVEFPAPIYAMYFVDNWSSMQPEGFGKVQATFFAI